jgi:dethiobiotin synthetase
MSAIFVTATGTDIGKTFVAAGLIRHFRTAGRAVAAIKPVVTGYYPAEAAGSDPGVLLTALGEPAAPADIERVAPFRFAAPLAPAMAARHEKRTLDFDALLGFCRRAIADHDGLLLIEGVGGIMVPLDERHTVLDWMAALKLPLVLVAGSYLGTVSHTLSALDVLLRRELTVTALIVNETARSAVTMADTMETLNHFAGGIPIVALPRLPPGAGTHAAFETLAALLKV